MFYKHIQGVLSPAQCRDIIELGYEKGFEEALVNMGDGTQKLLQHVRNNERVLFTDPALALQLEARIAQHIPKAFKDVVFAKTGEFFRLYKYVPGQYFKTHRDGSHKDTDGTESEITALFYLNDTDGGETVLMPLGKNMVDAHIIISPKQGDVLLFEHHFLHEGRQVNSGEKFVLRTDIFYRQDVDEAANEIEGGMGFR